MLYGILQELIVRLEEFEADKQSAEPTFGDFLDWLNRHYGRAGSGLESGEEPYWEGKERGRSAESVINTMLVHMFKYARLHAKNVLVDSPFVSQDDFIYLISLRAHGDMSKMALIRRNIHEKPVGSKIIKRLIEQGWAAEYADETDKRVRMLRLTASGAAMLDEHMDKIRVASKAVTGDLTTSEKMQLIRLLLKLDAFHNKSYQDGSILRLFDGEQESPRLSN